MPRILIRTITTKKAPFDFDKFEREIRNEMNKGVKPDLVNLLEKTVVGWRHKPVFKSRVTIKPRGVFLDVFASGPNKDQYNLVDSGAKPHAIAPRTQGNFLRFRTGYKASTTPKKLTSRRSSRSGPQLSAKVVRHPGFEAREFYKTAADVEKPEFQRRIKNALARATRAHRTS